MPLGLFQVGPVALQQWRRVDFRVEVKPGMKSITDQNGAVVSVAYQKPYTFEMPDKIPTIALLPPPHCWVCNRPISKIQIICTPDGASIEASCHGQSNSKFLFIESLTSRGPNSIYQEMLEAFSYKGALQKSEGLKGFDGWKTKNPKWKEVSFRTEDIPEKYNFDPGPYQAMMKKLGDKMDSLAMAGLATSSIQYTPDCCLCKKPVRVTTRDVYERDGYEVMFECHGRREVLFLSRRELAYSGRELGGYVATASPFLSDFKRLNIPEEPPKQKPKPRTGLTITIGQERIINLE